MRVEVDSSSYNINAILHTIITFSLDKQMRCHVHADNTHAHAHT
jgi:hypothetical protein